MQSPITISSYLRIALAGFDIEVKNHNTKFRVLLKRGDENVAVGYAARSHRLTNAQAIEKARLNTWGETTEFYAVLAKFADIAETLSANNN